MEKIKLTKTVQKGGCAAKVAASELRSLLDQVQFPPRTNEVLVDGSTFDDAAIIAWGESPLSLVQTLDFFTPIVDTPKLFGRIAAANALSDVYAMGGVPVSAMAILAYPLAVIPSQDIAEMLQGACDVLTEARTPLVGGHSIDDDTLKFGLSVTGKVDKQIIWQNSNCSEGDVLVLTKALGTGCATAGLKREIWSEDQIIDVLNSMGEINNVVDFLSEDEKKYIHAATDITGFGLAGHSWQMAKASQVSLEFNFDSLPIFEISKVALKEGYLTKAHRTNAEYVGENVIWESQQEEFLKKIIFDPQTSGGLLLSIAPEHVDKVLKKVNIKFKNARVIGKVVRSQKKSEITFI